MRAYYIQFSLAALAALSTAGAVVLTALGDDATRAWELTSVLVAALIGQHLPTPGDGTTAVTPTPATRRRRDNGP